MSTIKYIASENRITFYKEGEIRTISRKEPLLFNYLTNEIKLGNLEALTYNNVCTKGLLIDALKRRSNVGFGVIDRIEELEEKELPIEPLISFLEKLDPEIIAEHPDLIKNVGTEELPLTWDGNLVGYQRQSWLRTEETIKHFDFNDAESTDWVVDYEPFKTVKGVATVTTFSDSNGRCPDCGALYEVLVQPQHIVAKSGLGWLAQMVTYLQNLGLRVPNSERSSSGIVDFTLDTSSDRPMIVRLPYNAQTASKMISALFNGCSAQTLERSLPQVQTQMVAVGV